MRHADLYIRPLEPDDLRTVTALLDESLEYDSVDVAWLRDKTFEDPDYDGDLTLCALDGGEIVGFAQGIIRPGSCDGYVKWFATRQDKRDQGVATKLFDRIEDILSTRGAKSVSIASSAPNYVDAGLDPRYTSAYVFLTRRGYTHDGHATNMTCDLTASDWDTSEQERKLAEDGLITRRAERADLPAIMEFLGEKFPGWRSEVGNCFARNPVSLHIILDGEKVIAFAAHSGNNPSLGWFGPMGTSPDYRGKGLGGVTLLRCLADMKADGFSECVIPWVGPIPFYWKNCGARVSRLFWQMKKAL